MDNAVALAAIGFAGTALAALVWFMKWLADKFITVLEKNTEAQHENLKFMKHLNGKFEKAYIDKRKEVEKKK